MVINEKKRELQVKAGEESAVLGARFSQPAAELQLALGGGATAETTRERTRAEERRRREEEMRTAKEERRSERGDRMRAGRETRDGFGEGGGNGRGGDGKPFYLPHMHRDRAKRERWANVDLDTFEVKEDGKCWLCAGTAGKDPNHRSFQCPQW